MQIYNTMTRKKEALIPLKPGEISMYVCGPTVYNYFHIGNARPFVVFDTLRRYLEHRGYQVKFIQNFTDIDDKLIRKANEEGCTVQEIADRYIREYYVDADALGVERATCNPRATEHVQQIIDLVQTLIDKGHAYPTDNGDVYFSVRSFPGYGKLSGQSIDDLESGARIDPTEQKRDPLDFALWKGAKPGGQDLIFPHHENEIAQSEAATGKPFARYWMHNGYINVDNQKMSKSLGNFRLVRDISKEFDLEAVRLFLLGTQYRNPVNFSRELVEQSETALTRLRTARERLREAPVGPATQEDAAFLEALDQHRAAFYAAMDDDLNTADALGALFDFVRALNTFVSQPHGQEALDKAAQLFDDIASILGILQHEKAQAFPQEALDLLEERTQARKAKDWARADAIREQLKALGYGVEDTKEGAKLKAL